MQLGIDFEIEGLDIIERHMQDKATVSDPVNTGWRQSGAAVQREMSDEAPRGADSELARGMDFEVGPRNVRGFSEQVKIGPTAKYGVAVARGTRPHFPPPKALERWVRLKLGVPQEEVGSVAFLIARKISKSGTEANPYHIRGRDNAKPELRRIWNRVADGIAGRLTRGR